MSSWMDAYLFVAALIISVGVPTVLARQLSARGSDQFVHHYLIKHLRRNGHKLFTALPRLLNYTPTAYPLFLHWALSHLPRERVDRLRGELNAAASGVQTVILYVVLRSVVEPPFLSAHAGAVTLAVASTPQLFHIYNARVTGISARPIGWLFFFVYWLALFQVPNGPHPVLWGMLAITAAYGVWGTSIFALQGLVLFSVLYGVLFGDWLPILGTTASLAVFLAIHWYFGPRYLVQYLTYLKIYATILAPLNVLLSREGVWRDLVKDIWARFGRSVSEGLQYAYGNPVVIATALNPLVFLAPFFLTPSADRGPFLQACARLGVVSLVVMFLTTFRWTRFLGEPERYVELAIPFSGTLGAFVVMTSPYASTGAVVFGYFAAMNALQITVAIALARSAPQAKRLQVVTDLPKLTSVINAQFDPSDVRFASNEEDITKYVLLEDWQFVWYWPSTDRYGDMTYQEAFSRFPFVRKESFERLIEKFDVNVCLLDKSNFGSVFDTSDSHRSIPILETPRYVVCRIERVGTGSGAPGSPCVSTSVA